MIRDGSLPRANRSMTAQAREAALSNVLQSLTRLTWQFFSTRIIHYPTWVARVPRPLTAAVDLVDRNADATILRGCSRSVIGGALRIAFALGPHGLTPDVREGLATSGASVRSIELTDDVVERECSLADVVAIDLELLDRSWQRTLAEWRMAGCVIPVLFLFPGGYDLGFSPDVSLGLFDFLAKPVRVEELLVRLRFLVRASAPSGEHLLRMDDLRLNTLTREVTLRDECLELTAFEFRLLHYLMARQGRVISQAELRADLGHGDAGRRSNIIEVYISRLRRKVGTSRIRTLKGRGYRFG